MKDFQLTNKIASIHLGKKSLGCNRYNPSLLVAVPRFENRKQYNIDNNNLPFDGWDIWHAYEFSVLCENGFPVTRVLKLRYKADSEFIVESKSLKLYLNSFNMTKFGTTVDECLALCKSFIEKDLSEALKTSVEVSFLTNKVKKEEIFYNYIDLSSLINVSDLNITEFKESAELLNVYDMDSETKNFIYFDSLRSNCRVTHQPDFGDVFIYYNSSKHIEEASLVKYLVSFRSEYHFHEECCEMIFKRLYDLLNDDDEIMVCALYTRRGGIDISPVRWSKNCNPEEVDKIIDLDRFVRFGIKQ